jgi:hypothetical protein
MTVKTYNKLVREIIAEESREGKGARRI